MDAVDEVGDWVNFSPPISTHVEEVQPYREGKSEFFLSVDTLLILNVTLFAFSQFQSPCYKT